MTARKLTVAIAFLIGFITLAILSASLQAARSFDQEVASVVPGSAHRVVFGLNAISYCDGIIDSHPPKQDLVRMRQLGASAVRLDASWKDIEPTPGNFKWGPLDKVITESRQVGLDPWVVLIDAPDDQCSYPRGPSEYPKDKNACPPILGERYKRFLSEFATRYRGKVTYVSIGNEPEHKNYFSSQNPKEYARVLSFSYHVIKAVNPTMQVGMAATGPTNLPFLAQMLNGLEGKVPFDFVEDHPYRAPYSPLEKMEFELADGSTIRVTLKEQLLQLRRLFVELGFEPPRVALTEFGWGAYDNRGDDVAVSLQNQAQYLYQTYNLLQADPALNFVFAGFWFSDRDWATAGNNRRENQDAAESFGFNGLVSPDGTWKPPAHAFRKLASLRPGS